MKRRKNKKEKNKYTGPERVQWAEHLPCLKLTHVELYTVPQASPGVLYEHTARHKPWALMSVAQKYKRKGTYKVAFKWEGGENALDFPRQPMERLERNLIEPEFAEEGINIQCRLCFPEQWKASWVCRCFSPSDLPSCLAFLSSAHMKCTFKYYSFRREPGYLPLFNLDHSESLAVSKTNLKLFSWLLSFGCSNLIVPTTSQLSCVSFHPSLFTLEPNSLSFYIEVLFLLPLEKALFTPFSMPGPDSWKAFLTVIRQEET